MTEDPGVATIASYPDGFDAAATERVMFPVHPWLAAHCSPEDAGTVRWSLDDTAMPFVPEAYGVHEKFMNGIELLMPERDNDRDRALDYLAVHLANQMHEALEWVKVDGERLAIPHPENDMRPDAIPDRITLFGDQDAPHFYGYWDWMTTELRKVIEAYCDRYPTEGAKDASNLG